MKKLIFILIILFAQSALALKAEQHLPQKQEVKAREIFEQVRCVVCQGESIKDSNAELARDLRFNIREQVKSGKESEEILDYLVERYGIKILMKPPLQTSTYILWFAPFVMLLFGAAFIVMFFKQNKKNQ